MLMLPETSPWGDVQHTELLCTGAVMVSTASHGGVMILRQMASELLSDDARQYGFYYGAYLCFEEDCDAPIAIRELMDKGLYTAPVNRYFAPGEYEDAINRSLQCWYPEYWNKRVKNLQFNTERNETNG